MFSITYEIITEESAEDGDFAETGFHAESLSLRDAISELRNVGAGYCEPSDGDITRARWFTFYGDMDFRDGSYTHYSLHLPEHTTRASRARIARLLNCR